MEGLPSQTIFVWVQLEREFLLLLFPHTQVLQEFHQQLFVQKNPAFQPAPDFTFQPADSDTVSPDVMKLMTQRTSAFTEHAVSRSPHGYCKIVVSRWRGPASVPQPRLLLAVSRPPLNIRFSPKVFYYEV